MMKVYNRLKNIDFNTIPIRGRVDEKTSKE